MRSAKCAAVRAFSSPSSNTIGCARRWHYPEPPSRPRLQRRRREQGSARSPAPEQKFRLVPFGQLRPGNDPGYLVDELIPLRGIVLIWGKRKCLKSFWTYDLSFHIAHYHEYRGRSCCRGRSSIALSKARTATRNGRRHCGVTTKSRTTRRPALSGPRPRQHDQGIPAADLRRARAALSAKCRA